MTKGVHSRGQYWARSHIVKGRGPGDINVGWPNGWEHRHSSHTLVQALAPTLTNPRLYDLPLWADFLVYEMKITIPPWRIARRTKVEP